MLTPLEAELLDELRGTLSWLTSYPGGGAMNRYDRVRAAIAKAEASQSGPIVPLDVFNTMVTLRDAAKDYIEDLESGIQEGIYEEVGSRDAIAAITAAIERADALLSASQSGPMPGDAPPSGEPGAQGVKPLVYVTVSGGVAEIEVEEPNSVLVLLYDFDNAGADSDYGPEPKTWAERRAAAEALTPSA